MKRPIPSFTVEVRRRPGRAGHASAIVDPFEAKPPRAEFDRETDRAIAAIFGPKTAGARTAEPKTAEYKTSNSKADGHVSEALPALAPMGRVLDSLVMDRPLSEVFDAEPSPESESGDETRLDSAPAPRSRRVGATRTKGRRLATPSLPDELVVAAPLLSEAYEGFKTSAPIARKIGFAKSKAPVAPVQSAPPAPSPGGRMVIPALASPQPTDEGEAAAEPRKRKIMGRYVYGDEPKPGQRWKHKLRRKW